MPVRKWSHTGNGIDMRQRKTVPLSCVMECDRSETKFHRLYEFGKVLPHIRLKLEEDLTEKELNKTRLLATVISLMERTYIRIGNSSYEKMYGSYGLTTLKDKHVSIKGDKSANFLSKAKKAYSIISLLRNNRLEGGRTMPRYSRKRIISIYDEDG